MNKSVDLTTLELGFDVPAKIGMRETEVQTPCLLLDLDALEDNISKMGRIARQHNIAHRVHGKMHKSVDVALLQQRLGGASGVCCQKVSEAEAFARGGIKDILITNQVRDPVMMDRMARLPLMGTRTLCCVDDILNVGELSKAADKQGSEIECLVELDIGANRCGVTDPKLVVEIASAIQTASGLKFSGLQAYQGSAQHLEKYTDRKEKVELALAMVTEVISALKQAGLSCETVSGAGTGSYNFESESGVYTELQCGSYAFMDADYGRVLDKNGQRFDQGEWKNALFILTGIMSHSKPDRAICDAGLKSQSVDSGLPVVFNLADVKYTKCSDEHGVIEDPANVLKVNDKLRLVPGHCDPTCNLHDWYVGVRNGVVEVVWPVSARGKMY